jgi:hypothetical protein
MKRILIALSVVALNGCALYDAYMMTGYDSNEYRIITEIRTDAGIYKDQCEAVDASRVNAMALSHKTMLFQNYESQIPRNSNGINASQELNKIAQGLKDRYKDPKAPVSVAFCKLKFTSIENSAETIQHVVGKRPR